MKPILSLLKTALVFTLCLLPILELNAQLALIPYPQKVIVKGDSLSIVGLTLNPSIYNAALKINTPAFESHSAKNKKTAIIQCNIKQQASLKLQGEKEGYVLYVLKNKIEITANSREGLFRATQTLQQLMHQFATVGKIPCLEITDYPKFSWRGMHLDCCRHFFSKEEVKQYIDMIAMYKMNTFHWHLTDDQGWRIEIKKYPLLTKIGGSRKGSMIGPYKNHEFDSIVYGGYYSQNDIKEVVAYAASKYINVIPEIEMPGHSVAALTAYPQYACFPRAFEVEKEWGVFDDVFCTKDSTLQFLKDILDEVCALFPSNYIHIGGDECPKTRWKTCMQCQGKMKKLALKDENELQSWFVQDIEKHLNAKGKKIIGWDEILEGGLAPNAAVMSWRGEEGGTAAANLSHAVVMTPGGYCYFDHYQDTPITKEPLAIGGYTSLSKVYNYQPIPKNLPADKTSYILGAQGNVWTEYITTFKQVQYMSNPRICALAEILWTANEIKDFNGFKERLKLHSQLLDALGINYCPNFLTEN